ncbi:crcB protein [Thermoplasmatales archaeon BRNA1]|nr:crcB protein [Thermoplasmatales archaeon BRNA1]
MDVPILQAILIVGAGGALGAVLRFGMGQAIDSDQFPWATFAVNIIGSFLLALLMFSWTDISDGYRLLLFTGLFGAFTTMSTFTVDTVELFVDGYVGKALMNFVLNPVVCLLGAFAGRALALAL